MTDIKRPGTTLVSQLRPQKSERELIIDVAHAVDSFREAQERHNAMTLATMQRQGSSIEQLHLVVAELSGHVARADATARQASSHDLRQDAEIAELKSSWKRAGEAVSAFLGHETTKQLVKIAFVLASAYAAGKGLKVLP